MYKIKIDLQHVLSWIPALSKTIEEHHAYTKSVKMYSHCFFSYPCRVVIEKQPFAEGGMRFCLRLFELEDNGDFMPVSGEDEG